MAGNPGNLVDEMRVSVTEVDGRTMHIICSYAARRRAKVRYEPYMHPDRRDKVYRLRALTAAIFAELEEPLLAIGANSDSKREAATAMTLAQQALLMAECAIDSTRG